MLQIFHTDQACGKLNLRMRVGELCRGIQLLSYNSACNNYLYEK